MFYRNGAVMSARGHHALSHAADQIGATQYRLQSRSWRGRKPAPYRVTETHRETVRMMSDPTVTDAQAIAWVTSPAVMAERFA